MKTPDFTHSDIPALAEDNIPTNTFTYPPSSRVTRKWNALSESMISAAILDDLLDCFACYNFHISVLNGITDDTYNKIFSF